MRENLLLVAAVIGAPMLFFISLWCFGFITPEEEPEPSAKTEPRRVRAGQPVIDLDACERAGMLAAVLDFDDDTKTSNPEIYNSQAFSIWAVAYEKTMHDLHAQAADSMLPAP